MKRFSEHGPATLLGMAVSIAAGTFSVRAVAQSPADVERNAILKVSASQQVSLHVRESTQSYSVIELSINGEPVSLHLTPHSLRPADFEVWEERPDGTRSRVVAPPVHTVRGTVTEWDGNVVVGSLTNGKFTGRIRKMDGEVWIVQPLSSIVPGASAAAHVVFSGADVLPDGSTCGLPDMPRPASGAITPVPAALAAESSSAVNDAFPTPGPSGESPGGGGPGTRGSGGVTQISFSTDYEFYVSHGSSLTAMIDDIETILAGVDDLYRSQTGISYVFNRLIYQTTSGGPYTSSDSATLLDQFRDHWEDVYDVLERDLAHLMTGKDLEGGVVGRAYLGEVCNRDGLFSEGGYGLSQRISSNLALRIALTAHELGHNWDAEHCAEISDGDCPQSYPPDCGVMCACLGGCNGSLTQFGQSTINQILTHRFSRDCLDVASSLIYVNEAYSGPEHGTLSQPYTTFREGLWAVQPGGTVVFFGGTYDAERTSQILDRVVRLEARAGTGVVTIGQ